MGEGVFYTNFSKTPPRFLVLPSVNIRLPFLFPSSYCVRYPVLHADNRHSRDGDDSRNRCASCRPCIYCTKFIKTPPRFLVLPYIPGCLSYYPLLYCVLRYPVLYADNKHCSSSDGNNSRNRRASCRVSVHRVPILFFGLQQIKTDRKIKEVPSTMRFELTRATPNGLAGRHLNHSATSTSAWYGGWFYGFSL